MNKSQLLLFICVFLQLKIGQADLYDDDPSETDFYSEIPVVLSASRLLQPVADSPASLTVIDQQLIEATGATNIVELFRLVPGFQVGYVRGHIYSVSYHGLADRYARDMQVLINGRSVYDPGYGGVPWANLPLEMNDITRIEVIRGPNASAYGSNAFAGVINIITKLPVDGRGAQLKVLTGNHEQQVSGRFSGIHNDLSARLTVAYKNSDGLNKAADDYHQNNIDFNTIYTFGDGYSLDFSTGFSRGTYDDGFKDDFVQPLRETKRNYTYQQLLFKKVTDPGHEYQLRFYHNFLNVEDDVVITDSPIPFDLLTGYGFKTHRYDLEFQQILKPMEDLRIVWGLGGRYDDLNSFFAINPNKVNRYQYRSFFNIEQQLFNKAVLNLGLMAEKFENKKSLFSPKLGFNFHLNKKHTVRISYSEAYRVPTLYEDNADLLLFIDQGEEGLLPFNRFQTSLRNLTPTKIKALELGYIAFFPKQSLHLDAKLYYEKIKDRMTNGLDKTIPDPISVDGVSEGSIVLTNDSNARRKGFEVALKWQPTQNWFSYLTYETNRVKGKARRRILPPSETTPRSFRDLSGYVPQKSLSLLTNYNFNDHFNLSVAWYYTAPFRWAGDGDRVDKVHRFDLTLTKPFELANYEGKAILAVKNLTDQHYADFYNQADDFRITEWERQLEFQLQIHFN